MPSPGAALACEGRIQLGYVELRAHSAFSFGDGVVSPERLVARAAEQGYPALGVTDSADVGGVIRFTLEAERRGVKPIAGVELGDMVATNTPLEVRCASFCSP